MKKNFYLLISAVILLFSCNAKDLLNFKKPPVIDEIILEPQIVNPNDTVYAEVKATNPDEGVLSYHWSVVPEKGTFIESRENAATRWVAPIEGDVYTFKIEVSNSDKSTDESRTVTVLDLVNPVVSIKSPANGSFLVQYSEIEISAEAIHKNGIDVVKFYVNDSLDSQQSGNSSNFYNFSFTPDSTVSGKTDLKVEATAKIVGTVGSDVIEVNVEPILPGK